MFSEELKILDRNTVQYMIDEMEAEIKEKSSQLREKDEQLQEKNDQLQEKDDQLQEKDRQLAEQNFMLENVCRSLVSECREKGENQQAAEKILCERVGMDQKTAVEMVKRFWKE